MPDVVLFSSTAGDETNPDEIGTRLRSGEAWGRGYARTMYHSIDSIAYGISYYLYMATAPRSCLGGPVQ